MISKSRDATLSRYQKGMAATSYRLPREPHRNATWRWWVWNAACGGPTKDRPSCKPFHGSAIIWTSSSPSEEQRKSRQHQERHRASGRTQPRPVWDCRLAGIRQASVTTRGPGCSHGHLIDANIGKILGSGSDLPAPGCGIAAKPGYRLAGLRVSAAWICDGRPDRSLEQTPHPPCYGACRWREFGKRWHP